MPRILRKTVSFLLNHVPTPTTNPCRVILYEGIKDRFQVGVFEVLGCNQGLEIKAALLNYWEIIGYWISSACRTVPDRLLDRKCYSKPNCLLQNSALLHRKESQVELGASRWCCNCRYFTCSFALSYIGYLICERSKRSEEGSTLKWPRMFSRLFKSSSGSNGRRTYRVFFHQVSISSVILTPFGRESCQE